jgi:hypothetical protein
MRTKTHEAIPHRDWAAVGDVVATDYAFSI